MPTRCKACTGIGYFELTNSTIRCSLCKGSGFIPDTVFQFTLSECKALMRVLEKQWISHDDEEIINVVNKLSKITR